jgi:hypothetical protein
MMVDRQITPTAGSYNAVIFACAKFGLRRYTHEAFKLAKEILTIMLKIEVRSAPTGRHIWRAQSGDFSEGDADFG